MRCDSACPSSVPLSQMHNEARGEYVARQMEKLSTEYVRNRIISNYHTSAWLASKTPRIANVAMNFGPARWLIEKTLGVTAEREFPEFATQTFEQWWARRGGAQVENTEKQVAYFHGCYSNYNTPEVAKAMVRVFEYFDYQVFVPPQKYSGTPMFANGMLDDARRHAETNVEKLAMAINEGADVIASCTSCALSLRQEYPELFDIQDIEAVSANTFESLEYLRIYEDLEGEIAENGVDGQSFAYQHRVMPGTKGYTARRSNSSTVSMGLLSRTSGTRVRASRERMVGKKKNTIRRCRSARRCSNTWKTPRAIVA